MNLRYLSVRVLRAALGMCLGADQSRDVMVMWEGRGWDRALLFVVLKEDFGDDCGRTQRCLQGNQSSAVKLSEMERCMSSSLEIRGLGFILEALAAP